ncbi:MAG TPA: hypothetical protein VK139_07080, partial [Microbacteriaceae bacterium]|nr:hypothetical protein [Microbacteriaceae bacterium]
AGGAAGAAVTYGLSTGKKSVQGLSEAVGHGLITGAVGGALFGGVGSAAAAPSAVQCALHQPARRPVAVRQRHGHGKASVEAAR